MNNTQTHNGTSESDQADKQTDRAAEELQGVGRENQIYTGRFSEQEEATRREVWKILCRDFFSGYLSESDTVVDIGAGDGHFLRNVSVAKKIAVDLSEHVKELEKEGVEVHQVSADSYAHLLEKPADLVFMSNFLEHLPNKRILLDIFEETHKALRSGGSLLILQPNIKYVGTRYWDYIDHHIALTENAMVEALTVTNYEVVEVITRFLPYTAKSKLGHLLSGEKTVALTEFYLKNRWLWPVFGKQSLVLATPKK